MVVATRRAAASSSVSATASSSSSSSASTAASAASKRTWGERLAMEAAVLLLLAGAEFAWWHLRGRVSFAPRGTEAEDGKLLFTLALQCYAAARLALAAFGAGLGLLQKLPAPIRAIFWAGAGAGGALLAWHKGGGAEGLAALAASNQYTFVLYEYLSSPDQKAFFHQEIRLVGRLLGAILAWQVLLTVAYYLVVVVFAPVKWLFSLGNVMGKQQAAEEEEAAAAEEQTGSASSSSSKLPNKGVIGREEEED